MAADAKKKRGSLLTAAVVLLLLLIAGLQLLRIRGRIDAAEAEQAALAAELAEQQQENRFLEAALERADDPEYLQQLARERLNMVSPGQKDFYDVSN